MKNTKATKQTGWVAYPKPPNSVGNFVEDMDLINLLIGSSLYEWSKMGDKFQIRRLE